ncbi:MAG TPA: sugar transferase [Candidatus Hydrogenedentes bacterium]|nr:sugar transferase [Candidatus Hydrogenedentota bacterium]
MSFWKGRTLAYALFLLAADGVAASLAAYVTAAATFTPEMGQPFTDHLANMLLYTATFMFAWFWAAWSLRMFRAAHKDDLAFQVFNTVRAAAVALCFSALAMLYLRPAAPEAKEVTVFGLTVFVLIAGYRALICVGLWLTRQYGYNFSHVLLVGANDRTYHLVDTVLRHARFGYRIAGILEDDVQRLDRFRPFGLPRLGGFQDLERIVTQHIVDEVHICLPVRSFYETIQSMAHLCVGVGVSVRLVADLFPLRIATSRLHQIEDIPMLSLSTVPESNFQLAVKRAMDIGGALFLIMLLSPLFLLVAVLIKLDSEGPVFFRQERVGRNQRRIKMIKFRSMVVNAEQRREELLALNEADGPVFKIRDDPRITRAGKWLRKYSIDELPQLFNVLRGEMSLVGPRPLPPAEVEHQSWNQRRRLSVKPGMTGLWQVSGRSDLPFTEWVNLDLKYIDRWSIFLDLWILMKTCYVVIRGHGAA